MGAFMSDKQNGKRNSHTKKTNRQRGKRTLRIDQRVYRLWVTPEYSVKRIYLILQAFREGLRVGAVSIKKGIVILERSLRLTMTGQMAKEKKLKVRKRLIA